METPWESSEEGHCLPHPVLLSVPMIFSHLNRDMNLQTEEALGFSLALRQLQAVTQAKAQLEWKLVLEWDGLTKNHKDQWAEMTEEQED